MAEYWHPVKNNPEKVCEVPSHAVFFSKLLCGINFLASIMKEQLTADVAPEKIRYHHILHDLDVLCKHSKNEEMDDFKKMHRFLAQHYGLSQETLLLQGIRRAYRQIVEGV